MRASTEEISTAISSRRPICRLAASDPGNKLRDLARFGVWRRWQWMWEHADLGGWGRELRRTELRRNAAKRRTMWILVEGGRGLGAGRWRRGGGRTAMGVGGGRDARWGGGLVARGKGMCRSHIRPGRGAAASHLLHQHRGIRVSSVFCNSENTWGWCSAAAESGLRTTGRTRDDRMLIGCLPYSTDVWVTWLVCWWQYVVPLDRLVAVRGAARQEVPLPRWWRGPWQLACPRPRPER